VGANQVGRNHAGLRKRMGLFARLRSANRALPAAASDLGGAEQQRELAASALRDTLSELSAREAPAEILAKELNAAMAEVDGPLGAMQRDLLERFDAIPFVSLRASIPRSVETHRPEVLALLEILLGARRDLLERLPQVEYLVTMLSTDEVDGRRNIVHDPVTLTPVLENFSADSFDPVEADAVAMELYQAATLDSESENFHEILRSIRAKKQSVGLGCLCPTVLRAVVTYNARMFNSVESIAEASRVSDQALDEVLSDLDEEGGFIEAPAVTDEIVEEETTQEAEEAEAPSSVFDSVALQSVIEAMCARLTGGRVGRRGPAERIAMILDQSSLDSLETAAIRAESPSTEENIVARTAIVGLMLRDMGPLQGELANLGITAGHLSDAWVRELNESFGQLITEKLADPKAYDLTSRLSGLKTKHLLKPLKLLNSAERGGQGDPLGRDHASDEMRRIARAATASSSSPRGASPGRHSHQAAQGFGFSLGASKVKVFAAAALIAIAFGLTAANVIGVAPADIRIAKSGSLRHTSPYLKAAYRNEKGRGGLLIGRVDSLFVALPIEGKIDAAEEMVENFEIQGIREAMLYDARGMMHVQYSNGTLHRPRLGDRSTGRAEGESAVRRSLTGERLDEIESNSAEDDEWGDDF
jgi:hypothetical protein